MPPARKSTRSASSSRRSSTFKEPAALKRLNKSIGDAEKALKELRNHAGRNTASTTQGLYKGLGKFLSEARRDSTKFASAIKKDFEQAAKAAQQVAKSSAGGRTSRGSTTSSRSKSSATRSRSTTSRSSGAKRSTAAKRSTGSTRRSSTRKSS